MRILQTALLLSLVAAPAFARGPDSKVEPPPAQNAAALQAWIETHPAPTVPPAPDTSRVSNERH